MVAAMWNHAAGTRRDFAQRKRLATWSSAGLSAVLRRAQDQACRRRLGSIVIDQSSTASTRVVRDPDLIVFPPMNRLATMQSIMGLMSRAMLEHYSHIRAQARRDTIDALENRQFSMLVRNSLISWRSSV